jgi:hypothetical protein
MNPNPSAFNGDLGYLGSKTAKGFGYSDTPCMAFG